MRLSDLSPTSPNMANTMNNAFRVLAVAVILASLAASRATASINLIDFEDYATRGITPMSNSPGASVPGAPMDSTTARLHGQYYSDLGVVFSSTEPYVAVVGGSTGFAGPTGIGGVAAGDLLSYADPVKIEFFVPGSGTPIPLTYNYVSIQADTTGINGSATLTAFDVLGNAIASQTLVDVGGEVWTINLPGIHSVEFDFPGQPQYGSGTGIALDNLQFGDRDGAAPEPASVIAWGGLLSSAAGAIVFAKARAGRAR